MPRVGAEHQLVLGQASVVVDDRVDEQSALAGPADRDVAVAVGELVVPVEHEGVGVGDDPSLPRRVGHGLDVEGEVLSGQRALKDGAVEVGPHRAGLTVGHHEQPVVQAGHVERVGGAIAGGIETDPGGADDSIGDDERLAGQAGVGDVVVGHLVDRVGLNVASVGRDDAHDDVVGFDPRRR